MTDETKSKLRAYQVEGSAADKEADKQNQDQLTDEQGVHRSDSDPMSIPNNIGKPGWKHIFKKLLPCFSFCLNKRRNAQVI